MDLHCITDVDRRFRTVDGIEEREQAAIRRLTTPRGKLYHAPDYGLDVRAELRKRVDPDDIATLPNRVENELTKDPRFYSASAVIRTIGGTRESPELALDVDIETDMGVVSVTIEGK